MPGIAADVAALLRERGQASCCAVNVLHPTFIYFILFHPTLLCCGCFAMKHPLPGPQQPFPLPQHALQPHCSPDTLGCFIPHRPQVMAQGAPSNAELLELWQRVAPPSPAHSAGPSRKSSRLSRLLSRATSRSSASTSGGGGAGARFARWLSASSAGGGVARLLGLPAGTVQQARHEGAAASAAGQHGTTGQDGESGDEGIPVMEVAGDTVDLDGLTLVLSAANAASGGELAPLEVRAAARAIMLR